jgi:uncharacterized protein
MANVTPIRGACLLVVLATAFACARASAADLRINLDPPGPREFILDKAGILDAATKDSLRKTCDKLLTDKATPIVVVTIKSMAEHGGAGLRIETFARLLFDQWQVGVAKLGDHNWNTGILLLVSVGDRKARIELGAGWGREKDQVCQQIMDQRIIPQFKQGDFPGGIVAGVEALEAMARDKQLPTIPRPWWHYAMVVGFIGLAIFTVVSMIRRGSSGWAWLFWGALFAGVGYLLYTFLTSSSSSGSGGGFSGGSFGGGFSGGGGASGSW